jgi:ATP-dependent Clp protease ATP-binding subunit ClpB
MIRADKFTLKSQEALQAAQAHAQELGNPQVTAEHLLYALVSRKTEWFCQSSKSLALILQAVARDLSAAVSKLPKVQGQGELYMSATLNRILGRRAKRS